MATLLDWQIVRKSEYRRLRRRVSDLKKAAAAADDLAFLKAIRPEARGRCIDLLDQSKSQLRQDLFVLSETDFRQGGYFVEFGAANGVELSNTHLLEKEFGWTGILAEPARVWREALRRNRTAVIEEKCVWSASGETLTFNETEEAELSTIDAFSDGDGHSQHRTEGQRYEVQTISLNDLLASHAAPERIDYMSVDTEGSEYDILRAFDFGAHDVRIITCEHNDGPNRPKIADLLGSHGFERRCMAVSQFDDWYVKVD